MTAQIAEDVVRREKADAAWARDARPPVGVKPRRRRRSRLEAPQPIDRNLLTPTAYPRLGLGLTGSDKPDMRGIWRARAVGYDYAKWQLEQLALHHAASHIQQVDPLAQTRMLHHLRSLLQPGTLYPTMSVDEDGDVIAEWRVADYGLELVVTRDEATWALRKRGKRQTTSDALPELRTLLGRLTDIVNEINPGWTSLFPRANSHVR
jgi:hypothetical protein